MSTLIKNGTLVNADGSKKADVFIENTRVSEINESITVEADRIINATGKYIIPGGIDVHTHLDMPFGGTVSSDDFTSGHIAAAFGGTTSHIDFVIQSKGQTLREAVELWHDKVDGKACIDYAFHVAVTDVTPSVLKELPVLTDLGITSIKLFMAYKNVLQVDDETLFRTMQIARDNGILTCVHAENGDVIDVLVKQTLADGNTDPIYHARSRPHLAEAEATARAVHIAALADAPLFVVHLSCASALEHIHHARIKGYQVMAETCSQYLFATEDDLARPEFEGAKYVCSPPVRTVNDQEALWQGLANGDLVDISTDHCPFNFKGQKELGRGDFSKIPNGLPGIEDRLMVTYHHGVGGGRFSIEKWVEVCSTNPAKIFGMYPQKGVIKVGSDADIVIWNPEKEHTISAKTHHMHIDYNIYEGMTVKGMPELVFSRGSVIIENGQFKGEVGAGRFVRRKPIEEIV